MSASVESRRIKDTIKTIIRKKGYKYEDLANALDVSVNTVKRVLNKDDITLDRLNAILKWLRISLSKVVELSEESGGEVYAQFTEQQEDFLASNIEHFYIFEELMTGKSLKDIKKKFSLDDQSMQRYLLDLDKQNILELHPNGRVRTLVKGLATRRGGPLCQLLSKKLAPIVKENLELGLLFGNKPPKFTLQFNTNAWVRPKTLEQLHKDVQELVEKYKAIGATEVAVEAAEDLTPVVWFFMVNNTEINDRILEAPKKFS